jgi:hypothetical protein
LDATDLSKWHQIVYEPALSSILSFLSPSSCDNTTFNNDSENGNKNNNSENINSNNLLEWKKHICDVCGGKSLNGLNEWNQHCKSDARILFIFTYFKLF